MRYICYMWIFAFVFFFNQLQGMDPLRTPKIPEPGAFKLSLIAPYTVLQMPAITTTYTGANPYLGYLTIVPNMGHYNQPQYDYRDFMGLIQIQSEMAVATLPVSVKQELPFLDEATRIDYTISFWGPYIIPPQAPRRAKFYTDEWYVNLVYHPWVRTWAQHDTAVKFNPPGQDIYFNVNVSMGIFEADGIQPVIAKNGVTFGKLSAQTVSAHGPSAKLVSGQAAVFKDKSEAQNFLAAVASELNNFETVARTYDGEYKALNKIDNKSAIEKKVRDGLLKIPKAPALELIEGQDSFWVVNIAKIEKPVLPPDPKNLQLMFSPANAYFLVDKQRSVSSFWSAAHSPNKKYICVSYVILLNSHDTRNKLGATFSDSVTLGNLISGLENKASDFEGQDKEALERIANNIRSIIQGEQVQPVPALPLELINALNTLEKILNQLREML